MAAAVEVLRSGGNAVDAALAAGFAAAVSEPALTSLGGGGFLLHAAAGAAPQVLDFFCDVPGHAARRVEPHVETVVVDFARAGPAAAASQQVFHGGWGTVAVPGCFTGYLEAHRLWGRVPLAAVVAPATRMAREGVTLEPIQRRFLHLVGDLLALTPDSRHLFAPAHATGRYANPAYAELLAALATGQIAGPHDEAFAEHLLTGARDGGGLLTESDLASYTAILREPLAVSHGGADVWTNPPPSFGGGVVAGALALLPVAHRQGSPRGWATVVEALADATEQRRAPGQVSTGTTHVSVIDADGSTAAMTTSNGSGSGTLVPGWGVTLNNMLGEEDLNPGTLAPGARMGSAMSPTLVQLPDGSRAVLGTGGSERIRSALLCVLVRLIDEHADLADAIGAPRLHVSPPGPIHLEPGIATDQIPALIALADERGWPGIEAWPAANLFFGGVHAVRQLEDGSLEAVGDRRRSGSVAVVLPDGEARTGG